MDFKRPKSRFDLRLLRLMCHCSMQVGVQDLGVIVRAAGFDPVEARDTQLKMFGCLRAVARK